MPRRSARAAARAAFHAATPPSRSSTKRYAGRERSRSPKPGEERRGRQHHHDEEADSVVLRPVAAATSISSEIALIGVSSAPPIMSAHAEERDQAGLRAFAAGGVTGR